MQFVRKVISKLYYNEEGNLMKKSISAIIALVLILVLSVPVFAAQPEVVDPQACNHTWGPETQTVIWSKYSPSQCKRTVVYTKVCTKCAQVSQRETSTTQTHEDVVSEASCNGTTQTWIYRCKNCETFRYKKWPKCPGAGKDHSHGCSWLPV